MSEAEDVTPMEPVKFNSFAERVWHTFQLIDVGAEIESKSIGRANLEYLPWANAWRFVMNAFPESTFEFDDLARFDNGTAEQWVTVTIRDGKQETSRRWWLPVLNHQNQPVSDPNAMQINNTRMRVLVKCLAMMGLGTELYAGEDVPDKENDKGVVSGSVVSIRPWESQTKASCLALPRSNRHYSPRKCTKPAATLKASKMPCR